MEFESAISAQALISTFELRFSTLEVLICLWGLFRPLKNMYRLIVLINNKR